MRKVSIINITQFQTAYQELNLARANYNVVVARCVDYLEAVNNFFSPADHKITRQSLAAVLASERLYIELSTTYLGKLTDNIERAGNLDRRIKAAVGATGI